jgi:ISXO2-like transposase domain/Transposase zinc-ribbon domain
VIAFNPSAQPQTLVDAIRHFSDPDTCTHYVASIKWPDGPCCPKCGCTDVGHIKNRGRYQCRSKGCRKQFSLIGGTIMEASHLRLDQWCVAVWMIANCRNGVSSCEIARALGIKQQSAWHLLHRVRAIVKPGYARKLSGTVEADESFVGGALRNMHRDKQNEAYNRGLHGKTIVQAMLERGGEVRAMVLDRTSAKATQVILQNHVERGSTLYTDKSNIYKIAGENYVHEWVNHAIQYVRDSVIHTNGLENFFSLLRRAIRGTYVAIDPMHLEAYVDMQAFRFNYRKESDWERFDRAMHRIVGKRLRYSELTRGCIR